LKEKRERAAGRTYETKRGKTEVMEDVRQITF
jgi:hypothetical protein